MGLFRRRADSILRPWESVTIKIFPNGAASGRELRIPALIIYALPILLIGMTVGTVALAQEHLRENSEASQIQERVSATMVDLEELRDELQGFTESVEEVVLILEELEIGEHEEGDDLRRYLAAEATDLETLIGPLGGGGASGLSSDVDRLRASRDLLTGVTKRAGVIDRVKDEIPNRWPVVAGRGRVTLEFGPAIHPITGSWYLHKGFDVADFTGTPVVAMAEGTVTKAEFDPYGYGNQVVIEHKYGFETSYAHMNRIDVREGQWVQAGQRIGTVGMTGIATGTHVHVELSLGGQIIDPAPFIRLSNDFEPYSR